MADTLERVLRRARGRLLRQAAERRLARYLRPGLAGAVVVLAADKLWRLRFEPWWLIGTVLGLAVVAALALGRRRLTTHGAALLLDERLGLNERLSSAVSLAESGAPAPSREPLLADAERHAAAVDLRRALPRTWPAETRACLVLAAALLVCAVVPRFDTFRTQTDLATELVSRQVGQELAVAAEQAERQAAQRHDPRARAQARALYREALRLRRARLPKDEALRRLDKVQRSLQQERERRAGHALRSTSRQALDNLRRQGGLSADLAGGLEDPRQAAAQELLRQLSQRLRDGQLGEAERRQAAEQLRRAAEGLKGSPYQKQAEALDKAAQALEKSCRGGGKSGDEQAAKALDEAAKALGEGAGGDPSQQQLEDLQEQVQNGKDSLGRAEDLRDEAKRNGGQCPNGLCQPKGNKPGEGAGKAGRGFGPGTTNEAAEPTPSEGAPQEQYHEGDSPPDQTKAEWERLYAPRRTETMQDDQRVGGKAGSGGRVHTQSGPREAPRLGNSRVPYQDVIGDYRGAAEDAMSRGDIPATQRQRVKRYFDDLRQPEGPGAR